MHVVRIYQLVLHVVLPIERQLVWHIVHAFAPGFTCRSAELRAFSAGFACRSIKKERHAFSTENAYRYI